MREVAGFDPEMKDRIAECDGGSAIAGTRYAGRQEFTGRLTGEYVDHGDPPWRWYLMTNLAKKPDNYPDDAVWCESGNLWVIGKRRLETENRDEAAEKRRLPSSSSSRRGYRGRSPLTGGSWGVPPISPSSRGGGGPGLPPNTESGRGD